MMINLKFKVYLLILLSFIYKSYTGQQYSFYKLDESNGVSKNTVLGINQSKNGEIYIGTHYGGLNVINGVTISSITKNEGLVDNVVYDIINLNDNRQLITTNNGVSVLSGKKIKNLEFKDSLASKRIYTGIIDGENIWLATGKGVSQVLNDTIVEFITKDSLLNNTPIIHIRKDDENNIWCASMGAGVFKINFKTKDVINYRFEDKLDYTFQTFNYSKTTIWFLTYRGVFELKDNKVSKLKIESLKGLKDVYYHSAIRDKKGNIWIATLKGLIRIDNKGNEVLFSKENGLSDNEVWKVFEDKEENIWVLHKSAGVSKLTTDAFIVYNENDGVLESDVKSVYIDNNSKWLGTRNGLYKLTSDSVLLFKSKNDVFNDIGSISSDKGKIIFSSIQGMNELNEEVKNTFTEDETSLNETYIYNDNFRIYVTSSVQGVFEFKNNELIKINDSLGFPDQVGVYSITKTPNNTYWYATETGLYKHSETGLIEIGENDGLSKSKVRSLAISNNGQLWVGSSEGLFYQKGEKFYPVYKGDSINNHSIYAFCFDLEGNIWASKIDGIDKVVIKEGKVVNVRHYDAKKGFGVGSLFNNSIALDSSNGHVLVGTDRGLLEINPYLDFPNTVESKTHIEDIQLFSQPTDWSLYADSTDHNGFPIGLELDYNQNYFTFNYIGICHKYPEGVRYRTKLVGLDKDWVEREDKRFVIYGNLKPGEYSFLLKSCNNEGIWNKEPVKFSFTIRPPFWQTWWFYSICFGIVVAGIYSYIKIRNANIQITQKNKEITNKNHEIEEKNNEIMDSITYAKRIQDSILPDSKMKHLMPNSFVLFQPKDIVSGDFYWLKRVEEQLLFAAVDCTGHGVPGAFVSMVGFGGLNRAVNEYNLTKPNQVLEKLSEFVVDSFAKHQSKSISDGMDASLCALDRKTRVLQYSGANNSIYIIRNNEKPLIDINGEPVTVKKLDKLYELKSTRRPIGKTDNPIPFVNYSVQLEEGDTVYLFTDGFPDQFGGPKGKKYMYKAFKRFLIGIQDIPIAEQKDVLVNEYKEWANGYEQVDDICVIGVRV